MNTEISKEELVNKSIGASIVSWNYERNEIVLSNGVTITYHPYETYISVTD